MPQPPGQSDFVISRPEVTTAEAAEDGTPVLPEARLRSGEASAGATRIMLILTLVMFFILFFVSVVMPHIPAGESP